MPRHPRSPVATNLPKNRVRIIIAGGGTGGHFFPALAVAESLVCHRDVEVRFVGTRWGVEARLAPAKGWRLHCILVRGWYRVGFWRKCLVLLMLPIAFGQCVWLLLSWRPALVLGVGGYASGPMLAVACLFRIGTAIQEQNVAAGITNRLLGRWVNLAFVPAAGMEFPRSLVTGTPVRGEIIALRGRSRPKGDRLHLLVLGGSQGAHLLNINLAKAAPILAERARGLKLSVLHQTGTADFKFVQRCWQKVAGDNLSCRVEIFIDDITQALWESHLVYSRSGASAIAELCAAGRACLLTPLSRSSGDHQRANARLIAEAGGGLILEEAELNPSQLAETILQLLTNHRRRLQMEKQIATLHHSNSADAIAKACLNLIQKRN